MRVAFHHIAYQPLAICNALSMERLEAAEGLRARRGSAGPVQMEGGVQVYRGTTGSPEYGKLVLVPPGAPGPADDVGVGGPA